MINLVEELQKAYHGDPWHGGNVLDLLLIANPEKVFTHPIPNAHSIAELTLHLIAWTEEVIERINGSAAKMPSRGDWPLPKENSTDEWNKILGEFKEANEQLLATIDQLDPEQWATVVKDKRNPALGTGVNNAQLINGLIQHHAYHAGQMALLLKF